MPQFTEVKLRSIKPSGKIERFHDSQGLYLEVSKAGGKYWRWKYHFESQEKRLSLGAWPDVSLKEASAQRDASRQILKNGQYPAAAIHQEKPPRYPDYQNYRRRLASQQSKHIDAKLCRKNQRSARTRCIPVFLEYTDLPNTSTRHLACWPKSRQKFAEVIVVPPL